MKTRIAVLSLLLVASIGVCKWSQTVKRHSAVDCLMEQVYAMKAGGHMEVTFE